MKILKFDLFKITQAWIYEHFSSIGRRDVNSRYHQVMPRAARYVVGWHISSFIDIRAHLDRLTYSDVIWAPYASHRSVRPFELISLFTGFIRYGTTVQKYLSDRVLRQFGYEQRIPAAAMRFDGGVLETIDDRWLHFADHLVTGLTLASEPFACSEDYMDWFIRISHPYISPRAEDDRLHVAFRHLAHSSVDRDPPPPPQQDHVCSVTYF